MKEGEMARIASMIDRVLSSVEDTAESERVRNEVRELSSSFPLYGTYEG